MTPDPAARAPRLPALLALGATILIWASFLVVTRSAMTYRLGSVEVGLLRFGIGALLFLPVIFWRRDRLDPGRWARARVADLVAIPLFGGIFFLLLLAAGLRIAPVADSGVFAPGMLPLYVALLSALLLGERFTGLRRVGFVLIVAGALGVGGWEAPRSTRTPRCSGVPGAWRGHLLFTGASLSWAVYTVAFRRSGLDALSGAALLTIGAGCGFALLALVRGVDYSVLPPGALALQVVFQGLLSGFAATFTYFYAVEHIGASRSAACAALVPVLAALGGWVFLAEPIGAGKAAGIVLVAAGVVLASGALTFGQRVAKHGAHRV